MIMMAIAAVAAATPAAPVEALLRVVLDSPTMTAAVRLAPGPAGRTFTVDCTEGCPSPVHFAETMDDTPLGLFQPFDAIPIVVAISTGGSAYHVRAYRLTDGGVTRVLDAATRSAPGFAVADDGAIVVDTTERRDDRTDTLRHVRWTSHGATFTRSTP